MVTTPIVEKGHTPARPPWFAQPQWGRQDIKQLNSDDDGDDEGVNIHTCEHCDACDKRAMRPRANADPFAVVIAVTVLLVNISFSPLQLDNPRRLVLVPSGARGRRVYRAAGWPSVRNRAIIDVTLHSGRSPLEAGRESSSWLRVCCIFAMVDYRFWQAGSRLGLLRAGEVSKSVPEKQTNSTSLPVE